MNGTQVGLLTGSIDIAVIVAGVISLGLVLIAPRVARWGIIELRKMIGLGDGVSMPSGRCSVCGSSIDYDSYYDRAREYGKCSTCSF